MVFDVSALFLLETQYTVQFCSRKRNERTWNEQKRQCRKRFAHWEEYNAKKRLKNTGNKSHLDRWSLRTRKNTTEKNWRKFQFLVNILKLIAILNLLETKQQTSSNRESQTHLARGFKNKLRASKLVFLGRSSVWLEHLTDTQKVNGSSPFVPTVMCSLTYWWNCLCGGIGRHASLRN